MKTSDENKQISKAFGFKRDCQPCKKGILTDLIVFIISILLFILLTVLKTNATICEWWSRTLSRGWIWLLGHITGWIGISLLEVFFLLALLAIVVIMIVIVVMLCKKNGYLALKFLIKTLCVVLCIAILYVFSAGFAYNRCSLPIEVYDGQLTYEETKTYAEYFVQELNDASALMNYDNKGEVICPYTTSELSEKLKEEYKRFDGKFDGYFSKYTPTAKGILLSSLLSEARITGIFFAITGEANVNVHCPKSELAVTMAHEMAHGKGVMRENDANLTAFYLTLTSEDDFIRYSGLYYLVYTILNAVSYYPDSLSDYEALSETISDNVKAERLYGATYWSEHDGLEKVENWFNDIYLKLSGVKEGTDSYYDTADNEYDATKTDSDGRPIATVINFSRVQRLIFQLIKQGEL